MHPFNKNSSPIAIIGMGCRLPGEARDPESFWQMLLEGRSGRREVPSSRYNVDSFYHADRKRLGTTVTKTAHFMEEDFATFDAPFFSITAKEATAMDPQQRHLLEVTYEGLESAGIRIDDIRGSNTSCYIGTFASDFRDLAMSDLQNLTRYHATGESVSIASNRLSWFFDLRGPSMTIETACSSSLVSLHLACQSLRSGESEMSIVGGTNMILDPGLTVTLSGAQLLAPDGKCKTFDESASGYSRGEGTGILILKTLEAALRDGDTIRAIVSATATNQDGRTPGISLPSTEAQETLIRSTYQHAGLDPSVTGYVEAHGTGTAAGDPVEMAAIANIIGSNRTTPFYVGSVKTNIGHLEGGAGVAAVIKAALTVERGIIPPNLWFEKLNPRISLNDGLIKIPTSVEPWPTPGLRRASVNSFGFGGANAHAVIDDAYHYLKARGLKGNHRTCLEPRLGAEISLNDRRVGIRGHAATANGIHHNDSTNGHVNHKNPVNGQLSNGTPKTPQPKLFVLSSHDRAGIRRSADVLRKYVTMLEDSQLDDLAYTLSSRRSNLSWRSFIVASTAEGLYEELSSVSPPASRSSYKARVAFVFTGQGAQWHAMGKELLAYEAYRSSMDTCDALLRSWGCTWSLLDELSRPDSESRLHLTEIGHPACAALQIALVDLLRSWDIQPVAVVGHSGGEIAAAYCSGAVPREYALKNAWLRAVSVTELSAEPGLQGAMLAVNADAVSTQERIENLDGFGIALVACINSPKSVTVSGDATAIEELRKQLKEERIACTRLKVPLAFHSPHVAKAGELFMAKLAELPRPVPLAKCIPMFSSVTGALVTPKALCAPSYWVENLLLPVRFSEAVTSLFQHSEGESNGSHEADGNHAFTDTFLEVGPHSALRGPLKDIFESQGSHFSSFGYSTILRRGFNAVTTSLQAVGYLHTRGYEPNMLCVNGLGVETQMLVSLPPYPWNHEIRYWSDSRLSKERRFPKHPRHELLGYPCGGVHPQWRQFLRVKELPWVQHHQVQSSLLYPGAGMLCMAIEGAHQILDPHDLVDTYVLSNVVFSRALQIPDDDDGMEIALHFQPQKAEPCAKATPLMEFTISSFSNDKWTINCTGFVQVNLMSSSSHQMDAESFEEYGLQHRKSQQCCTQPVTTFYQAMESAGIRYGEAFQNLAAIYSGVNAAYGTIIIPDTAITTPERSEPACVIHPTILDTVMQLLYPSIFQDMLLSDTVLPQSLDYLSIAGDIANNPGHRFCGVATSEKVSSKAWNTSITVSSAGSKAPKVVLRGLVSAALPSAPIDSAEQSLRELCSTTVWKEDITLLSNEQITEFIISSNPQEEDINDVFAALDRTCLLYSQQTLQWLSTRTEGLDLTSFMHMYLKWMETKTTECSEMLPTKLSDIQKQLKMLKEGLSASRAGCVSAALIDRIGEHLPQILSKEIEPLQLMFEDDLLNTFYLEGWGRRHNENIASFVELASYKRKDSSILEIGAGTGGTTHYILERIRQDDGTVPIGNYTFTDISPSFLSKAADRFRTEASVMTFKTLNIEEDPLTQGFEPDSFDFIVASNVLHATKGIVQTLTNVRKLLKPGGRLLLSELTLKSLFTSFIMGVLPGWWLGKGDGRTDGPLLSIADWDSAMRQVGFSGVEVSVRGENSKSQCPVSLLVTMKPIETKPAAPAGGFMVVSSLQPEVMEMATSLQSHIKSLGYRASVINWDCVSQIDLTGMYCISLAECGSHLPLDLNEKDFSTIQKLLTSSGLLWLTKGAIASASHPESAWMTGLARSIRNENPTTSVATFDLPSDVSDPCSRLSAAIHAVAICCLSPSNVDFEYAMRNGIILVPRIEKSQKLCREMSEFLPHQTPEPFTWAGAVQKSNGALELYVGSPGHLETLAWQESGERSDQLDPHHVEIQLKAVGLNSEDVLIASGGIKTTRLGLECSGIITNVGSKVRGLSQGDRVYGAGEGTLASFVRLNEAMVKRIPDNTTFEEGASIPFSYLTAYYSIVTTGGLCRGESILIHAGTDSLSQAAVSIAEAMGAEVYIAVSSKLSQQQIKGFYGLTDRNTFSISDPSLVEELMKATAGRGVDVVLNPQNLESLRQCCQYVAPRGRLIDISSVKTSSSSPSFDIQGFLAKKPINFYRINPIEILNISIPRLSEIMGKISMLIHSKLIKPLGPLSVFKFSEVESALKFVQSCKLVGKVVLTSDDEDVVMAIHRPLRAPISSDATYVVVGQLGNIVAGLGYWLAQNGARNLVILSNDTGSRPRLGTYVRELSRQYNIRAVTFDCEVSDENALRCVLQECVMNMPPVKGLISGPVVMRSDDSSFASLNGSKFRDLILPQVRGIWNLHQLLPKNMDFFITMSSVEGLIGARGQGPEAATSSFQTALADYRRREGLASTSVNLGHISNLAFQAQHGELVQTLEDSGFEGVKETELHAVLSMIMRGTPDTHIILGMPTHGPNDKCYWMADGKFSALRASQIQAKSEGTEATVQVSLQNELTTASDQGVAATMICNALVNRLAVLMMVPTQEIDASRSLSKYGVDSLVAVEIRNWAAHEIKADVSVFDIMRDISMSILAVDLAQRSAFLKSKFAQENGTCGPV